MVWPRDHKDKKIYYGLVHPVASWDVVYLYVSINFHCRYFTAEYYHLTGRFQREMIEIPFIEDYQRLLFLSDHFWEKLALLKPKSVF